MTRVVIASLVAAACVPVIAAAAGSREPVLGDGRVGQFASPCEFSHRAEDDPIVFPERPGASHRHDFIGNRSTDARSTRASLRRSGSLCARRANRSAYWVPTLYCVAPGDPGPRLRRPPRCARGERLKLRIRLPECWDGRSLDSPDHSSHLASALPRRGRRHRSCPESHPVAVPELVLGILYSTRGGRAVRLASGPPATAHADFFNGWDQRELTRLVRRCLNRDVRCRTR